MTTRRVVICDGARTPFTRAWGELRALDADDLGRIAVAEAVARSEVEPATIDEVILGNIAQPAHAANLSRVVALRAGLPVSIPAFTVNRNCASSLEAIASAALRIESGRADIVVVGGTESMSNVPLLVGRDLQYLLHGWRRARRLPERLRVLARLRPRHFRPVIALERGLTDPICGLNMGQTAEVLARRFAISRDDQDRFAMESHHRAERARAAGRFAEEITPVFVPPGYEPVASDDGIRAGQSLEALARLPPVFDRRTGTVTAGNASQITDGAAALVLAAEDRARRLRLPVLGALRSWAFAALPPEIMGLGPVHATPLALDRAGLEFRHIGLIEINEAFAAQVIANEVAFASRAFARTELNRSEPIGEIDRDRLNVNGGAVALGHPVGASGARLVHTLLREMRHRQVEFGLAALCAAGGQGAAFILEAA